MKLKWKKEFGYWQAWCGNVAIGSVGQRDDGTCFYRLDGLNIRWIGKGYGTVMSIASAKRAVARVWEKWLTEAGLRDRR